MFALRCLSFSIMSMAAISAARAELTLSNLFSNEMVLQCEMPVDIWGQASPNTEVRVTLGEQSLPTTSDAEGNWRVTLEPLTASFDPSLFPRLNGKSLLVAGEACNKPPQANYD